MASLVLGAAGAVVGGAFFGPMGASIGWALGSAVGNIFFAPKTPATLHDLHLQGSSYGAMMKIFWGKVRISGNVIWETDLQQHDGGGKGGGKSSKGSTTTFTASWDTAICETQVAKLVQIYALGRLNYDFNQSGAPAIPFTFYDGNPTQLPDPTEEAVEGAGNVPAYRGISRIVYHDRDMTNFGNTIPQESFVVTSTSGAIPWRVSTFDAHLDSAAPFNIQATYDAASGIITVCAYLFVSGGATFVQKQFMIDGTPVGSTVTTTLDLLAGLVPTTFDGAVINLPVCYCVHQGAPDIPNGAWYVGATMVAPIDLGAPDLVQHPVYQNGYIYGISGTGVSVIKRWVAPDGVPTSTSDAGYSLGTTSSGSTYCGAGDGNVWVTDDDAIGTANAMWKFDADLNLIHIWTFDQLPSPWHSDFQKFFYKGMVAVNTQNGSNRQIMVYRINADFTFTLVGSINQDQTPNVQLVNGLTLGVDGVVSLDPPDGSVFLSEVVADICDRAGLTSGQYDVTQLSAILVDGFVIESQTTCRAAIEMLMPVYFFDAVESDGVIKFVVRGGPSIVTFLDDDLAAHMDHDSLPSILSCVHTPDVDLPSVLNIAYINKDADYQVNTQTSQRMVGGSRDVRTVTVPIVLTDSHAKKIVDSWLYNAWSERDAYTWQSSRKYAAYEPTDVVTVQGKILRITKKLEGATGVIKWEGVPSRGANFTQAGAGGAAKDPSQVIPILQKSQLVLLDLPLLQDADAPNGIYAAMAGAKSASYSGGQLFKSLDGTTYDSIAIATRANTIGSATTVLGNYTGPNVVDFGNTVRVTIGKGGGMLTSTNLLGLLNGSNEGVLGLEVFQWMTATLVSAGVYDLSGLLRGRRGTEWATSTHTLGEAFVAFDPAPLNPPAVFSEIGSTEYYKAVTAGQTVAGATAQTFANIGNALKCYSPMNLGGGCDASGNVTGNFLARTRIGGDGILAGPKPLSETTEAYIVQIWDSSYTVCARIIPVTAQTFSYSGANAVTDFGALQHDIFWTVGQIGAVSIGAQSRGSCPGGGSSNTVPLVPIVPYSFNPIITPPLPPGGGGPVDGTLTWPGDSKVIPMTIGQRKVYSFTTGASVPNGHITVAEYQSNSTPRHCYIATDSAGLNKVANTEQFNGTTAESVIGTGGGTLAALTTYYYVFDFLMPDGSLSGPAGANGETILNFTG